MEWQVQFTGKSAKEARQLNYVGTHEIDVTQSDISQMETGSRKIGRKIAQRIEKLFDIDYRSFLE